MSRIAIMKHLTVLHDAGLVVSRKQGRQRWNYINFFPIRQIYERWMRAYQGRWAESFGELKRQVEAVESEEPVSISPGEQWPLGIDIQQEIPLSAAPDRVFEALTDNVAAWWGHPYLSHETTGLHLDAKLGGYFRETWGADAGSLLATVTVISPGQRLELTGPLHMGIVYGVIDFVIREVGQDESLLQFSHRAIGHVAPEVRGLMAEGWNDLLSARLKSFLESGERRGIDQASPTG